MTGLSGKRPERFSPFFGKAAFDVFDAIKRAMYRNVVSSLVSFVVVVGSVRF